MGDSGALLLGFVLATVSIQGLLKTASTVTLFLPLLVLAVPILDTSFVVARRLKHGLPVYAADRGHLHHRFVNIGFSQRRAALTIYAWALTLAIAALATRFVPFRAHGIWHPWWTALVVAIGLIALGDLDLHRLPARDRQAREPACAPPPPRGGAPAAQRLVGPVQELGERIVEARPGVRAVAAAAQDEALGVEPLLEHVTGALERGMVVARHDELRERLFEPVEGDHGPVGRRSIISIRAPCSRSGGSGSGSAGRVPDTSS